MIYRRSLSVSDLMRCYMIYMIGGREI